MSLREEDRQKNSCPSRGLGLAAAAIGVGVGAALYYFFNKRADAPHGEGSTAPGWNEHTLDYCEENGSDDQHNDSILSHNTISDGSLNGTQSENDDYNFSIEEIISSDDYNFSMEETTLSDDCTQDSNISLGSTAESTDSNDDPHLISSDTFITDSADDMQLSDSDIQILESDFNEDSLEVMARNHDTSTDNFEPNILESSMELDGSYENSPRQPSTDGSVEILEWNTDLNIEGLQYLEGVEPRDSNWLHFKQIFNNLDHSDLPYRHRQRTEEKQMKILRAQAFRERSWSLEECSICFEIMLKDQQLTTLPCAHHFHSDCIAPWLQEQQTCPNCRKAAE